MRFGGTLVRHGRDMGSFRPLTSRTSVKDRSTCMAKLIAKKDNVLEVTTHGWPERHKTCMNTNG